MRRFLIALVLLLLPAAAWGQQRQSLDAAERRAMQVRRDSLERVVVQKFIDQLTRDLKLDATQRTQTEAVLKESGERRKELAKTSDELRGRMYRALRESATPDADYTRMLSDFEVLRMREHYLWQRDQEALARIYSPRQRVQFLISWLRFQEAMTEIRFQRTPKHEHPQKSQ